jgi:hypothetical protein
MGVTRRGDESVALLLSVYRFSTAR